MDTSHHYGPVLITGASSGIGEDAALYLNEVGYTVFAGVVAPRTANGSGARQRGPTPSILCCSTSPMTSRSPRLTRRSPERWDRGGG
jgi:NAD(P)-dependent dehydrogenase (short-subunit alcohol dehydrogenase family)